MPSVGAGVAELRVHADGAFRVLYVAKFAEGIYIVHAFQKHTRKAARMDLELARKRYRVLMNRRADRI